MNVNQGSPSSNHSFLPSEDASISKDLSSSQNIKIGQQTLISVAPGTSRSGVQPSLPPANAHTLTMEDIQSVLYGERLVSEAAANWFPLEARDAVSATWKKLDNKRNASEFSKFLDCLAKIDHAKEDLTPQVRRLVAELEDLQSDSLYELIFILAREAATVFKDRAILYLNLMQQACMIHAIEHGRYDQQLPELIHQAREIFRLEKLKKFADEKMMAMKGVDEIEVYLAYQVKLREPLALHSASKHMHHFDQSNVSDSDLDTALKTIKRLENQEFLAWFSEFEPWNKTISRIAPELFVNFLKECECVLESIHDAELHTLSDDNATAKMQDVIDREKEISITLTKKILADLGLSSLLEKHWENTQD